MLSFMEGQQPLVRILEEQIADFESRELPRVTPRRLELPGLPGKIDVVVGMRRSGKTYFVYQQIAEWLRRGVGRERLLYLNFEDERLLPMAAEDLHLVTDAFYRRYPASRDELCYFFFDEIQNVPGWERYLRRLLDSEKARLVITGSSAKLLSREIATSLRGRSLATELLPFSFAESLVHAGIELPERWPPPARTRSLLENRFERYLEVGGFPEVQGEDGEGLAAELRVRVLQDYLDVALLRDVAERHGIDNLAALRYLQKSLLSRPASRFSIHRLFNDLKSQGVRVGKDTLHQYLSHLEDAYLLFVTSVASSSVRARQTQPRKCYPVDPALAAASSFRASRDRGHLLENVVYLELRRRGHEISYVGTRAGHEVDFLAEHPARGRQLVQVAAEMTSPSTSERELRALGEAIMEWGIEEATVVTLREERTVEVAGRKVRVVPAWRFLLEE